MGLPLSPGRRAGRPCGSRDYRVFMLIHTSLIQRPVTRGLHSDAALHISALNTGRTALSRSCSLAHCRLWYSCSIAHSQRLSQAVWLVCRRLLRPTRAALQQRCQFVLLLVPRRLLKLM